MGCQFDRQRDADRREIEEKTRMWLNITYDDGTSVRLPYQLSQAILGLSAAVGDLKPSDYRVAGNRRVKALVESAVTFNETMVGPMTKPPELEMISLGDAAADYRHIDLSDAPEPSDGDADEPLNPDPFPTDDEQ